MTRPKIYVDFNEMLEPDLVLLSAYDSKVSISGEDIQFHVGQHLVVYMDDVDENGKRDDLIAIGVVERNLSSGWAAPG